MELEEEDLLFQPSNKKCNRECRDISGRIKENDD